MLTAAKAMALTAADLLTDASLRDAVRKEFEHRQVAGPLTIAQRPDRCEA